MRMQLSLLILSLQLAQIASAGDKARHSENDGLGRRQSKSSMQAGQVGKGSRSRLRSRQLKRDFEQKDRREEGDVLPPGTIESSRGIRKGVRKAAKKNNKNTKKILNRLDKAETVHVNKVSGFIR